MFTSYADTLPDPVFKTDEAGASSSTGNAGPGFAKVKFTSSNQTQVQRTISGRGVTASPSYHQWSFNISYNPLTRDEFEPVTSFLESRNGRRNPFYVVLPQYSKPRDSVLATFLASNTVTASATTAGSQTLMINNVLVGEPMQGDFFTITDPNDINHKKAYKVVGVETNTHYKTGTTQPSTTQRKLRVAPPITRNISAGATVNFINPKFRVIQSSDTLEHELDTDNLYSFSLSLEEILP